VSRVIAEYPSLSKGVDKAAPRGCGGSAENAAIENAAIRIAKDDAVRRRMAISDSQALMKNGRAFRYSKDGTPLVLLHDFLRRL
jgi:hypothetical protein